MPPAEAFATRILADDAASVAVRTVPIARAALLWSEPNQESAAPLLAAAVSIDPDGDGIAWADRYGGNGIGGNGGSGRAALVGDLYVKGIGPTPLIGATTKRDHVSGRAYLEEAMRETLFAELFARELPWGAVRTRAIVDVFEDVHWPFDPALDTWIASDRCVLLIRDPVLRPAHFQRAVHFTGGAEVAGAADARRVSSNFARLAGHDPRALLNRFWCRWAEQCAYLYAWRLTQGALSTSNIALDGRLLDFGASSSLPDWDATVICSGSPEAGYEFDQIAAFIRAFHEEHDGGDFGDPEVLIPEVWSRYLRTLGVEMLRVAGLRRAAITDTMADDALVSALEASAARVLAHHRRRFRLEMEEGDPDTWSFKQFWNDDPPAHLRPLRALADRVVRRTTGEPIKERMLARGLPRTGLSRERLRRRLHRNLAHVAIGTTSTAAEISDLIRAELVQARRDTRFEPETDWPCGFALVAGVGHALFARPDRTIYALEEPDLATATTVPPGPIPWTDDGRIGGEKADHVAWLWT